MKDKNVDLSSQRIPFIQSHEWLELPDFPLIYDIFSFFTIHFSTNEIQHFSNAYKEHYAIYS